MHINIRIGMQDLCFNFIPEHIIEYKKVQFSKMFHFGFLIQRDKNNLTK